MHNVSTYMDMDNFLLKSRDTQNRKKYDPTICYPQETDFRVKDTNKLRVKDKKRYAT